MRIGFWLTRRVYKSHRTAQAWPSLHVNADLRSLFGWNTKQVFVSIEVDYATERHPHNSMMIWARIIKKPVRTA